VPGITTKKMERDEGVTKSEDFSDQRKYREEVQRKMKTQSGIFLVIRREVVL
jgi:hypothetical protein